MWQLYLRRIKHIFIMAKSMVLGLNGLFSRGHLINYCIERNAGDRFNHDFIKYYFGVTPKKYSFGKREHSLFCGSILKRTNEYSIIVGAGFISKEDASIQVVAPKAVVGVRGYLTLNAIKRAGYSCQPQFVGDPGLLAREVVKPLKIEEVKNRKERTIGIIPHFVDFDLVNEKFGQNTNIIIIDIKRSFIAVCEDIKKCDRVLSSSLHGLVFADAMNVANCWVRFSSDIKGGEFKFHDYYSAMKFRKDKPTECASLEDVERAFADSFVSIHPNYSDMKHSVEQYFKEKFLIR